MIPAEVRALAEDPAAHSPAQTGFERILDDRYCLFLGPSAQMTMVQRLRLRPGDLEQAVDEVRELARERGRSWMTWWIGDSSTPGDVEARLRALGMESAQKPIHEPVYAALALTRPPTGVPGDVTARGVESFEEYVTAHEIGWDAFGQTDEQRAAQRAVLPQLFELHRQGLSASYVVFLDGRPVAVANAVFADAGVMLLGGATRAEARGRGCYRALVQARWEDAVKRGTPALVVQAGAMSQPILTGLGFEQVAELHVLVDRFA